MAFLMSVFGRADPGAPTNCMGESAGAAAVVIDGTGAGDGAGAGAGAGGAAGSGRGRGRMCFSLLFL